MANQHTTQKAKRVRFIQDVLESMLKGCRTPKEPYRPPTETEIQAVKLMLLPTGTMFAPTKKKVNKDLRAIAPEELEPTRPEVGSIPPELLAGQDQDQQED